MNLFINTFYCENERRQAEYDFCFEKNSNNPHIKRIIRIDTGTGRPTYSRFFKLMEKYPDDVNILANLDIYFDESISHADKITKKDAYCLTRHELINGQVFSFEQRNPGVPSKFSQDAWIFRGSPEISPVHFGLGIPGCDNKIAHLLKSAGYRVLNPCITIRAIHVHQYPTKNLYLEIPKPYYHVEPISLTFNENY